MGDTTQTKIWRWRIMSRSYYVLGVGYKESDPEQKHPYEVWIDVNNEDAPFVILEGRGMGGVGGRFKPTDILEKHWQEHLSLTGTLWLIPLCKDAVQNGGMLDHRLVLETFSYLHDRPPVQVFK